MGQTNCSCSGMAAERTLDCRWEVYRYTHLETQVDSACLAGRPSTLTYPLVVLLGSACVYTTTLSTLLCASP